MSNPTNPDPNKSCASCPSFLQANRAVSKFKKNIGAPVCGRYGHVLGKPGATPAQNNRVQQHFAANCPSYGEPMPAIPERFDFYVVMPDVDARTKAIDPLKQNACNTCASCVNLISDDIVAQEFGWLAGMCRAKGKLILSNRQVAEAKNCEYREIGKRINSVGGLHLLPEYENALHNPADLTKAYFKSKENFVDPVDYPTDREVGDEEAEAGIRAWRAIPDPDGSGNVAYLPIYRVDFFSEEEQRKIPRTNDEEHPELYIDHFGGVYLAAVAWSELDETPTLWGEAGTGKTELYRHLAWLMCLPFERISITASTELDEIIGKMEYTPEKGTYFRYGRIPLCWQKPCVLVLDEPNTGPVEVWQAVRPLTDNSKQLVIDANKAESLPRHNDCYLGIAMNPAWDAKNVGAMEIADADANRLFHAYVELPSDRLERQIIKDRIHLDGWEITDDQLDFIMAVAKDLRALSEDGKLPITWAIRPQIKVARALKWFSPVTAYKRAIADYLEPETKDIILDTVRAHVSGD